MGLNETPSGERAHIAFFGVRNAGKSSVVNAVTGQELSVVSDVRGTTTDPVRKAMELLPLGPVVIVDTPGIDDEGALGAKRVERSLRTLASCDAAVLVVDGERGLAPADRELVRQFEARQMAYVVAWNKCDRAPARAGLLALGEKDPGLAGRAVGVSALTGEGIDELKERLARLARPEGRGRRIVADLVRPGSVVVLVCPIDASAPRGRLILPQQMTIRDLLDAGCVPVVCRETELGRALASLAAPPALVVTDSQAFGPVARVVPDAVPLTSFSILMLRYKADLALAVAGAAALDRLRDGDRVLISEGCTHHRQCEDIGTVKMPAWLAAHTGAELGLSFTSGADFPDDLSPYAAVVHCGGCTLTAREMRRRQARAAAQGVPLTNYGVAIAHMHGILRRSLAPFPEALAALDG